MSDTPRTDEAFSKARAERGLYGMDAMTAHARQLERELAEARAVAIADYETVWASWVKQCRAIGAMIPCATGGTFELDPPDAILDAVRRTFQQMAKEITEARRLLADIRADAQCAHWHQDIDAAMKGK